MYTTIFVCVFFFLQFSVSNFNCYNKTGNSVLKNALYYKWVAYSIPALKFKKWNNSSIFIPYRYQPMNKN